MVIVNASQELGLAQDKHLLFFMDTDQTCLTEPPTWSEISVLGLYLWYSAALLAVVCSMFALFALAEDGRDTQSSLCKMRVGL